MAINESICANCGKPIALGEKYCADCLLLTNPVVKTVECADCGCLVPSSQAHEDYDEWFCGDCWTETVDYCSECACPLSREEIAANLGRRMCEECVDKGYW